MSIPRVFISATSGDLRSARAIARDALLTINCHPVEQTSFEPDYRTVTDMLRGKIAQCQALIHIVGHRYGAEPDPASLPPGTQRRSYTQMEYHLARELGLRVYTFLLPESYPYDTPPNVEDAELTALQNEHRLALQSSAQLYEAPADELALRTRIIALQEKVIALEQEQTAIHREVKTTRRWGIQAAAIVFMSLISIGWGLRHLATQSGTVSDTIKQVQDDVKEVKSVFTKERKFMALILARSNDRIKEWENMKPAERFELALDQIAAEEKIPAKELRDLLDLYVQRVEIDPDAEAEDKFYVLMRKQAFGEAAKLAQSEGESAEARMKQQATRREAAQAIAQKATEEENAERKRAIDFYQKEGAAHYAAVEYEKALGAHQKAAALVDKEDDPLVWCFEYGQIAVLLGDLARHSEAEPLLLEIVRVREQHQGSDHSDLAIPLNNLALMLMDTNRLEEAEVLMRKAVNIIESNHGLDHSRLAYPLQGLALVLKKTNRLEEAEPLFRRILKIEEATNGPEHPDVARVLNNLANMLNEMNRQDEAEPLLRRAVKIAEASYGSSHPLLAAQLVSWAVHLSAKNQTVEAEQAYRRALAMFEKAFSPNHPFIGVTLNNLALLLKATNRLAEAEPMYRRALSIDEASYGPDHPKVATVLNNLGALLYTTNRLAEAETMMRRALSIDKASYGPDHPNVARNLSNLALLLQDTNRLAEAEPLMGQALEIFVSFERKSGHEHPHFRAVVKNYRDLLTDMKLSEDQITAKLKELSVEE